MNDLNFYISQPSDPFSDIHDDQLILNSKGILQYEIDSILESIGSKSGFVTLDLYLNDIIHKMNDDEQSNFLNKVLSRIEIVYNVTMLENLTVNMFQDVPDKKKIILELINYFEKGLGIKILAKCLPRNDIRSVITHKCREFLLLNYHSFVNNASLHKETIPSPILKFYLFAPRDEVIESLMRMIDKDKMALPAEMVTLEMESENVNNQNEKHDSNENGHQNVQSNSNP